MKVEDLWKFLSTLFKEPGAWDLIKTAAKGFFGLSLFAHAWRFCYGYFAARSAYKNLYSQLEKATVPLPEPPIYMREVYARLNIVSPAMKTAELNAKYCLQYRSSGNMTKWAALVNVGNQFLSKARYLDNQQSLDYSAQINRAHLEMMVGTIWMFEDFKKAYK